MQTTVGHPTHLRFLGMRGSTEPRSLIPRRSHLPPRPTAFQPIRPRGRLLGLTPRASSNLSQPSRHPFLRSHKPFQQPRNIQIRIQPWEIQPESRRADLDLPEFRRLRLLQPSRIPGTKAHCQLGAELNHNPTRCVVVLRRDSPRKSRHQRTLTYLLSG